MARILVIDDDEKLCEMLSLFLEHAGYEVFIAENGRVALEMQRQTPADVIITDEYSADGPHFKKLVENTSTYFNIKQVSADAAYSSRKNIETVLKHGGEPFIMFKSNATGSHGSSCWRSTFHYFQLHHEAFLNRYHQRSNVETTFSAIKNKFGENIKSRNRIAQENEMLCKIIAYNITVLIHAMFELGISPNFSF